jgi:hypothetical protein
VYSNGLTLAEAKSELARMAAGTPVIGQMLEFIEQSERSLLR